MYAPHPATEICGHGIKTGYIVSSGFNLVASAKRGNIRLIAVVFGGSFPATRDARVAELLNQSFEIVQQGAPLARNSR